MPEYEVFTADLKAALGIEESETAEDYYKMATDFSANEVEQLFVSWRGIMI